ncbi:uncharacterized protein LOC126368476 [Pectinophora gossypiella]|uniref:uncharacterized protein LOC126368476 n=1 Tax=Pectinophora gossypiella TaxID=13191 RepID=UPI00214E6F1D|nr:uncharacterized protein LOC126368476 [Pectinophora gossypiella]
MFVLKTLLFTTVLACTFAQGPQGPTTTPVPILKQINRQNDDGSYSYGYEAADGSFKIETKYPNGDVAGKYGYVDEGGKLREISYGASSKRGFEPQGAGIMVPPPTLNDNPTNALTDGQEDDGQYREDPKIYEDPKYNGKASSRPSGAFRQFLRPSQPQEPQYQAQNQYQIESPRPRPQYQQQYQPQPSQFRSSPVFSQQTSLFSQPQSNLFNQAPQQFNQEYRPQSQVYHQQPQFSFQTYTPQLNQYQNQNYQNQNYQYQDPQNFNPFTGHPAQNFDPNTGSYSINFTG